MKQGSSQLNKHWANHMTLSCRPLQKFQEHSHLWNMVKFLTIIIPVWHLLSLSCPLSQYLITPAQTECCLERGSLLMQNNRENSHLSWAEIALLVNKYSLDLALLTTWKYDPINQVKLPISQLWPYQGRTRLCPSVTTNQFECCICVTEGKAEFLLHSVIT